jgi:amidohydrolase
MISYNQIIKEVFRIKEEIISIRRHIHRHPELSFQEYNTTEYIKSQLTKYGIKCFLLKGTGIIGIIGNGEKSILLRADIDALPIQEATDESFISKNDGIMHACGHDLHTAMLLATGIILKKYENAIKGKVILLFQPGEELLPGGAKAVIESGILDEHNIIAAFGQHVNPVLETGKIMLNTGISMASSDELYWTIKGKSCHAAQPNLGVDAILPATAIVQAIQNIQYFHKNPLETSIVSITAINGGNVTNVFPDTVEMKGTLRCFSDEWRENLHNILNTYSKGICQIYGASCFLEIKKGYPSLINDKIMVDVVKEVAVNLWGKDSYKENEPVLWAEDFAYIARKYPSCFWFLGAKKDDTDTIYPLHNPRFSPNEDSMVIGTSLLCGIAKNFFNF